MDEISVTLARRRRQDRLFLVLGFTLTLLGGVVLAALLIDLLVAGWPRLHVWFFTSFSSRLAENAGILAAWVGTLAVTFVTALLAIPLGVAAGIYLEEYGRKNWFTTLIEINISNLAGVPSIIYGLLGVSLFVSALGIGRNILAAGLTLGCLILPIVIVTTREALRTIPQHIREAAYAMGATKWQVIRHHLVPYSLSGIATGSIIGLSRAMGETAPLIVIGAAGYLAFLPPSPIQGEFPFLSFEWLRSDFTVLPMQMFNWTQEARPEFHANAAAAGLIIVLLTLSMNAIAIGIRYRVRKRISW